MLADEITSVLRAQRDQAVADAQLNATAVTVALESKGIAYGQLTAHPDGSVDTSAVDGVDPDLRVKPFFAEGSSFSMREFAVGAFNAEMGLESPDPDLLAAHQGNRVVTPAGLVLDGSLDTIPAPPVSSDSEDGDSDGVVNEIDPALVDHMEFYLLNYFRPGVSQQGSEKENGRTKFVEIGCSQCHVPNLTIERDRRVADVDSGFDPVNGVFNRLFATAQAKFVEVPDTDNPQRPGRPRVGNARRCRPEPPGGTGTFPTAHSSGTSTMLRMRVPRVIRSRTAPPSTTWPKAV